MMEFTLSRVTAVVCGAMILAAALVPFTGIMDEKENETYQSHCDSIADMIDTFDSSRTEELILSMDTLLPSAECILSFDGHHVSLIVGEQEYKSILKSEISADREYGKSDVVRFQKQDNKIFTSCESD